MAAPAEGQAAQKTTGPQVTRPAATPIRLLPAAAYPGDFQWHQRVTARWPEGEQSFEAVLAKSGDTLQLLGLGPLGRVGFLLRLTKSGAVEFENRAQLELHFEPRRVLLDVQRVYYPWFADAATSGQRKQTDDAGIEVSESYSDGHLTQRRFTGAGTDVEVHYEYASPSALLPTRARLVDQLAKYQLTIVQLDD